MICLEAWKSPFPYRIGDFADHGIVARVDFRRVDWFKTDRARSDAEAQTPHVFRNDPKSLDSVAGQVAGQSPRNCRGQVAVRRFGDDSCRLWTDAGRPGRAGQSEREFRPTTIF